MFHVNRYLGYTCSNASTSLFIVWICVTKFLCPCVLAQPMKANEPVSTCFNLISIWLKETKENKIYEACPWVWWYTLKYFTRISEQEWGKERNNGTLKKKCGKGIWLFKDNEVVHLIDLYPCGELRRGGFNEVDEFDLNEVGKSKDF